MKQVELRGKKGAPGRGAANARPDANRAEWRMWLWQRRTKGASVRDESLGGRVRPPRSQWAMLKRTSLVFKTAGSHPEGPEILLRLLWLQLIRQVAGCKRRGRRARRGPMHPLGTEPCTGVEGHLGRLLEPKVRAGGRLGSQQSTDGAWSKESGCDHLGKCRGKGSLETTRGHGTGRSPRAKNQRRRHRVYWVGSGPQRTQKIKKNKYLLDLLQEE